MSESILAPTPNPYVDPQSQAFLQGLSQALNGQQLSDLSLHDLRAALDTLSSPPPEHSDIDITRLEVDTSHGKIKTFVYKPKSAKSSSLPFIYHLHGGGWIVGNAFDYEGFDFDLVRRTGCAVVFPQYTLAPEAKYPTQQEQCLDVLSYVCKHGKDLGLDTQRVATLGDSAGAQLSTAVCILNTQKALHLPILHQVLLNPFIDSSSLTNRFSQYTFQDGPYLTTSFIAEAIADYFINPVSQTHEITASPILMTPAQAKQYMPSTTIVTSQADWCRDQGQDFAKLLQTSGVECGIMQAVASLHDPFPNAGLRASPTVDLILYAIAGKLRELLGEGK